MAHRGHGNPSFFHFKINFSHCKLTFFQCKLNFSHSKLNFFHIKLTFSQHDCLFHLCQDQQHVKLALNGLKEPEEIILKEETS